MKERTIAFLGLVLATVLISACATSTIGSVNPKKPKPYPPFSEEIIALGTLNENRSCFDVHHYDLDIEIDAETRSLKGWVRVGAQATRDTRVIQLDLDERLAIDTIAWERRQGQQLAFKRHHRAVTIQLPELLEQGAYFSVHIHYQGQPMEARRPPWAGGLVWKKDSDGNDFAGVACETEGASIWFPCKDHTSDEPDSVDLHFSSTSPDLMVVSNGRLMGKERRGPGWRYSWKVVNPINAYNISFYLGDYVEIQDTFMGAKGVLPIHHYVLRPHEEIARKHFEQAKGHLRIFEALFGPYPWYEDGFKLVESPYAGMEHQSAIAYGNGFRNDLFGKDDYIMVHEMGHEWFGNAVTARDLADVWLQEGFTTYAEYLFLEQKYGKDTADKHLHTYRFLIRNQRPVVGPRDRRFFDYRDSDVYFKGAWILHSFRKTLGDDSLFFSIIREFYARNKGLTTDSRAFMDLVNEKTGKEFDWFFQQYLYDRRIPILAYHLTDDGILYYRWEATGPDFSKMPARIWLDRTLVEIQPAAQIQRLDLSAQLGRPTQLRKARAFTLFGLKHDRHLPRKYQQG